MSNLLTNVIREYCSQTTILLGAISPLTFSENILLIMSYLLISVGWKYPSKEHFNHLLINIVQKKPPGEPEKVPTFENS